MSDIDSGNAAVDFSFKTVPTVANGEPLTATARTHPILPNNFQLPWNANNVDIARIRNDPKYNVTGLCSAYRWYVNTQLAPAIHPIALGTNTVLSFLNNP